MRSSKTNKRTAHDYSQMTRKTKEKVWKVLEESKDAIIKTCRDLIRIPTPNPPATTKELCDYIEGFLQEKGFKSNLHDFGNGVVALTSSHKFDGQSERSLILYAHGDVVPAGERTKWLHDPYSGDIVDGKIVGRGACDMKAGLTASLWAYITCAEIAKDLSGNITLFICPDEENWVLADDTWGTTNKLLEEGVLKGTACIMGEPTSLRRICVGEKGDYWIRLKVKGEAAHGSMPPLGDNAIEKAFVALSEILKLKNIRIAQPRVVKSLLPNSKKVIKEVFTSSGKQNRIYEGYKLLDRISVNIGTINGGYMINIVADSAEVEIAFCIPIGMTRQRMRTLVEGALKKAGLTNSVEIEEIAGGAAGPSYTNPNDPIVRCVSTNIKAVTGQDAIIYIQPSTSDASPFRLRGIPTCWIGPGDLRDAHTSHEYVYVEDVVTAAKIHAGTVIDYLS